jgi:hypothetical protein
MFCFRNKYTISNLNTPTQKLQQIDRGRFKIAVVDNEPFVYEDRLKAIGFNITKYDDVSNLDMLSSYNVIIGDIKGVGKSFNSEFEGAFVLKELKRRYPFKAFAAYTGSAYDIRINDLLNGVQIIKKDIDIDSWSNAIDALIKESCDPKIIWKKTRDILLSKDVNVNDVAKLENEYVDIILNKKGDFSHFPSEKNKKKLSADTVEIISTIAVKAVLSTLI